MNLIVILPKIELDSEGYLTFDGEYSKILVKMGFVRTSTGKWAQGETHEFTEAELFTIFGGWNLVEPVKEITPTCST